MLKILKLLLIVAAAFLLVANIQPYIELTRQIFGMGSVDVCAELRPIPFIGGVVAGGCSMIGATIYSLSGFLVWAVFQFIELLPIASSFNIPFISGMLKKVQAAPQVDLRDSDRESVVRMKKRHNTVIERSLSALLTFSWVMYIIDLALMCWLYSPLNEVGELNWGALIRVLLGVFGVEVVVLLLILINNIIDPQSIKYPKSEQTPVREY